MIEDHWRRVAGLYQLDNGDIGIVWIALEPEADRLHVYDCVMLRSDNTLPVIVGETINARGRYIPVFTNTKEIADQLEDRGCLTEQCPDKETPALAEVVSRDIHERMRTGRFKVNKRLAEWKDEYTSFYRENSKVPEGSHPLMAATRYAVANIDSAQPLRRKDHLSKRNYPKMAVI